MELQDVKGIDAILEQAGIYSTVSEQLADNLQDFKKRIKQQKMMVITKMCLIY